MRGKPSEPDPTQGLFEAAPEAKEAIPTFVGIVTSKTNTVIVSQVDSKVTSLKVNAGQRVKKGDILVRLDDTRLKNELVAARAEVSAAGGDAGAAAAQVAAARREARTESILARRGVASPLAAQQAQARLAGALGGAGGAGGRLQGARARVASIESQLANTTLTAPHDGVVTRVKVRDGVGAGNGTQLMQVFDDSDLLIRFKVDRDHRHLVKAGDRISFQIEGQKEPVLATINSVSDELEPPMNFIIVEADLDDRKLGPDEIRVAASGRVSLVDAITAPAQTAQR